MLKKVLLAAGILALAWFASPAVADSPLRQTPLGFCSLQSLGSAVSLASCTTTIAQGVTIPGIPPGANWVLICAYVQGIVWLDVATPTGTPGAGGQGIIAGQCYGYPGTLSQLQIIQQAAGAIVGVSFYK